MMRVSYHIRRFVHFRDFYLNRYLIVTHLVLFLNFFQYARSNYLQNLIFIYLFILSQTVFHFRNMISDTKFPSFVHEMIRPHSIGNYFSNRVKYIINRLHN
jgi:hypothetical protein